VAQEADAEVDRRAPRVGVLEPDPDLDRVAALDLVRLLVRVHPVDPRVDHAGDEQRVDARRVRGGVLPGEQLEALVDLVALEAGVLVRRVDRVPLRLHHAVVEPERLVAQLPDVVEAVAAEHDRLVPLAEVVDAVHALLLEVHVPHREDLVDDQHVGVDGDRDAEAQAQAHARRVRPHRLVDVVAELRELDDLVDLGRHLLAGEAHHDPVQEDVGPPGEVHVEAGAQLEQARHPPVDPVAPARGRGRARKDLEQRRLAGAIRPAQPERGARREAEVDVLERPEFVVPAHLAQGPRLDDPPEGALVHPVGLAEALGLDCPALAVRGAQARPGVFVKERCRTPRSGACWCFAGAGPAGDPTAGRRGRRRSQSAGRGRKVGVARRSWCSALSFMNGPGQTSSAKRRRARVKKV
jgi:hypothetical protein